MNPQMRQMAALGAGLGNAYALENGSTMLERLRAKKTELEWHLKKITDELSVVSDAVKRLEDDPKLESLLSLLGKENIL